MRTNFQLQIFRSPSPNQLAVGTEESDAVLAVGDGLAELDDKSDGYGAQGGEGARIGVAGVKKFPPGEAALGISGSRFGVGARIAAGHGGFVGADDFVGGTVLADLAVVDPDYAVAEAADLVELVGDEDDGAAGAGDVAHFAKAFFLEIYIAHRQDLVDEEDFGFEVGGYGEGQADVHAAGVVLYGRVDKFFEFGEGDDFVEFASDVALAHAEDSAGEKSVFAAAELGMETGAYFEEAADAAVDFGEAGSGAGDARKNFEERGFAGAVASDEAEDFAFVDVHRDIFEGPEGFLGGATERFYGVASKIFQGVAEAGSLLQAATIVFAEEFGMDYGGGGHGRLDAVGNGALHTLEEEQAAKEDDQDGGGAGCELRARGLAVSG